MAKIKVLLLNHAAGLEHRVCHSSLESYLSTFHRKLSKESNSERLTFVLPGFPYKSPNTSDKVFGKLPDLGEKTALVNLAGLMNDMSTIVDRPCHLIVCSDGLAFSDIKGIPEQDVSNYRTALKQLASALPSIEIKGLDDFIRDSSSLQRRKLLIEYGPSTKDIREQIADDSSTALLHQNLTAFARRDLVRYANESKRQFRLRCKETAVHVVRRSRAWAEFIRARHPDAIRLTIHPYRDVSEKFPVSLVPSVDGRWRTPWHNVPLADRDSGAVRILPRSHAERAGYALMKRGRHPWTFVKAEESNKNSESRFDCRLTGDPLSGTPPGHAVFGEDRKYERSKQLTRRVVLHSPR